MIKRSFDHSFETREEGQDMHICGYFSVFDSPYHITRTDAEYVARGAFADTLNGDIRALINHDTGLVLGRTTAGTLELREDEHGLYGDILINPNDQDAVNLYARVKRGDVSQCSFGFDIIDQETIVDDDGSIRWIIKSVKLYEVSVCTFPAYEATEVSARSAEAAEIRRSAELKKADEWRNNMLAELKGGA